MEKIKIKIANKIYNVEIAESEEELTKGLSNLKELDTDSGMLFVFGNPQEVDI